jgi:hypothetical protein
LSWLLENQTVTAKRRRIRNGWYKTGDQLVGAVEDVKKMEVEGNWGRKE